MQALGPPLSPIWQLSLYLSNFLTQYSTHNPCQALFEPSLVLSFEAGVDQESIFKG